MVKTALAKQFMSTTKTIESGTLSAVCPLENNIVRGVNTDAIVQITARINQFSLSNPRPLHPPDVRDVIGTAFAIETPAFLDGDASSATLFLTAYHVVAAAEIVECTLVSCRDHPVRLHVLAILPDLDVAVLCGHIVCPRLPIVPSAYDYARPLLRSGLQFGDEVLAFGYPNELTFTAGTVSRTEDTYIETTVALNAGNSGGPLLHKQYVVGINVSRSNELAASYYAVDVTYALRAMQRYRNDIRRHMSERADADTPSPVLMDIQVLPVVWQPMSPILAQALGYDRVGVRVSASAAPDVIAVGAVIAAVRIGRTASPLAITGSGMVGSSRERVNLHMLLQLVGDDELEFTLARPVSTPAASTAAPGSGALAARAVVAAPNIQEVRLRVRLRPLRSIFGITGFCYEHNMQENFGGVVVRPAVEQDELNVDSPASAPLRYYRQSEPFRTVLLVTHYDRRNETLSACFQNMALPFVLERVEPAGQTTNSSAQDSHAVHTLPEYCRAIQHLRQSTESICLVGLGRAQLVILRNVGTTRKRRMDEQHDAR